MRFQTGRLELTWDSTWTCLKLLWTWFGFALPETWLGLVLNELTWLGLVWNYLWRDLDLSHEITWNPTWTHLHWLEVRSDPQPAPRVLQSALLCTLFPFLQELHVQLSQLFQEAPVGDDPPAFLHVLNGVDHRHVLTDHEVSEEKCGRPTPSHHTVHQQFICTYMNIHESHIRGIAMLQIVSNFVVNLEGKLTQIIKIFFTSGV